MKKTILALACAVLLVAASVMGTLAYLTSVDTVTNTFTVGKVELGGDDKHAKGLDEAKTNTSGVPLDKDGNVQDPVDGKYDLDVNRVQSNEYKLQPGHTYTKDPTIHVNKGSDNCYLFVKVENGISAIEDSTNNIAAQMAAKGWKALTGYTDFYVYVGTGDGATTTTPKEVSGGADVVVFEKFKVADSVDNETLKGYSDKKIVVTAYGVQVDGFEGKTSENVFKTAFVDSNNIKAALTAPEGALQKPGDDVQEPDDNTDPSGEGND